jgi:trimeric autotransporter adhesin
MSRFNRFFILFIICASFASARAQTPSIEVTTGDDGTQFSTQGRAQGVHVEVFSPSGELVFEADSSAGQSVDWPMVGQKGERVADGVYLATITVTDSAGKRRKRIEQITVGGPSRQETAQEAASAGSGVSPSPAAPSAITGEGSFGKLAKFGDTYQIGSSAVTEVGGRVGVNAASPAANLHVNAPQPLALASNGTKAATLLQTSGGKGGNTTVGGGKIAGAGAGIVLYAGNGGNAPAGSKNGGGGNIVLQAGSAGGGAGTAGASGNVLINSTGVGNVAIGTSSAPSRLTVNGVIQTTGAGAGIKFPNGSVQTTAALPAVQHNATLAGAGTSASPLGLALPLSVSHSVLIGPVVNVENTADKDTYNSGIAVRGKSVRGTGVSGVSDKGVGVVGVGIDGVQGASYNGDGVEGTSNGGVGVSGSAASGIGVKGVSTQSNGVQGSSHSSAASGVYGENDGGGNGVAGRSNQSTGVGVYGESADGTGVYGKTNNSANAAVYGYNTGGGKAVWGYSPSGVGVEGQSGSGNGVYGYSDSGYAGLFDGKVRINGTFENNSDRNAKANISAVNPRSILQKVASLPIQSWNYRTEGAGIRHVGPMAQDFRAAFGLGTGETTISSVDADGVALASIQALYRQNQELLRTVERQSRQLEQLQARVARVERTTRKKRTTRGR